MKSDFFVVDMTALQELYLFVPTSAPENLFCAQPLGRPLSLGVSQVWCDTLWAYLCGEKGNYTEFILLLLLCRGSAG